jgi:hypothetical protein
MTYSTEVLPYRFAVRGVDARVVQLMRIAAVRLRMSQGEAVDAALRLWLQDVARNTPDRFGQSLAEEINRL